MVLVFACIASFIAGAGLMWFHLHVLSRAIESDRQRTQELLRHAQRQSDHNNPNHHKYPGKNVG